MDEKKVDDTSLEELERTTDLLRQFEPRISKEAKTEDLANLFSEQIRNSIIPDYSEEAPVIPVYEDVDLLESAPIPSVKEEKRIEEIEEAKEVATEPIVEEILPLQENIEKEQKYSTEMKKKRLGKIIMIISSILIPALIFLLVIASHSNLLINKSLEGTSIILLGICISLFLFGAHLYLKNRNQETIHPKSIWIKGLYAISMGGYIMVCSVLLFLLYGPNPSFKDWLVTTAMATMNHQHYCKWFYSDSDIADVFSRNYIQETGASTDASLIDTMIKEPEEVPVVYENEYEQAVLERDPGTLYKIINFEVNGCKAYLAVIYDPSKVKVTTTNKIGTSGQYVTTMAKRENAVVAINGGGFYDPGHNSTGGKPRGITIVNGKIITNNEYKAVTTGGIIGFTNEDKLVLLKNTTASQALEMGVRDAVSWGPFLIVNGVSAYTSGNGGFGYAARTAIGQRADGIVLLLVVDSNANRSKGANMVDLTRIMENYGAMNAANLDGGTSSVMAINGELINDPIDSTLAHQTRPISTAFIVTES